MTMSFPRLRCIHLSTSRLLLCFKRSDRIARRGIIMNDLKKKRASLGLDLGHVAPGGRHPIGAERWPVCR